jgi:hypothetical protein
MQTRFEPPQSEQWSFGEMPVSSSTVQAAAFPAKCKFGMKFGVDPTNDEEVNRGCLHALSALCWHNISMVLMPRIRYHVLEFIRNMCVKQMAWCCKTTSDIAPNQTLTPQPYSKHTPGAMVVARALAPGQPSLAHPDVVKWSATLSSFKTLLILLNLVR